MLAAWLRRRANPSSAVNVFVRLSCTTQFPLLPQQLPIAAHTVAQLSVGSQVSSGFRGFATEAKPSVGTSTPASSTSSDTPSPSSSGGSSEAPSSGSFTGSSASDSYAKVAHAGFESGAEGRFGYSRRYAANWDKIFSNKSKNIATEANGASLTDEKPGETVSVEMESSLESVLARSPTLPNHLKDSLRKLSKAEMEALSTTLETLLQGAGRTAAKSA